MRFYGRPINPVATGLKNTAQICVFVHDYKNSGVDEQIEFALPVRRRNASL